MQWKNIDNFKKKIENLRYHKNSLEEYQKMDFGKMKSDEFINTMIFTVHPFEKKGLTRIISPVQKAMTMCIYSHGGWTTESELVNFIQKHWAEIQYVSKQTFSRGPDARLLHQNLATRKNGHLLFLKNSNDESLIGVNNSLSDEDGGESTPKNEHDAFDNEELIVGEFESDEDKLRRKGRPKSKSRTKSNNDKKNKLENEEQFVEIDKPKEKKNKTDKKLNDTCEPTNSDVSEQIIRKNDEIESYLHLEIPSNLPFEEKVFRVLENKPEGVTVYQIGRVLSLCENDPGLFPYLPLIIRIRAILLEAKFQKKVFDNFADNIEKWSLVPDNKIQKTRFKIVLQKPFPHLRIKDMTISQLYDKFLQDSKSTSETHEFFHK
ncbi:hypothetical protein TRFO_33927 [Tritrichomonas foetus]|uniref:Uncharacterized protein n=1 Tax=Tritrichomonas foetus TaxID=1144522 RepID=A0A1J4JPZ0_9EUKA|nr:hypothetical protein TRFO_33927 [Tritrichomonas foetus]|eukprot:OHS99597.1 hypothetical protein TRFO_33927 [Tritrichomonas foetus]